MKVRFLFSLFLFVVFSFIFVSPSFAESLFFEDTFHGSNQPITSYNSNYGYRFTEPSISNNTLVCSGSCAVEYNGSSQPNNQRVEITFVGSYGMVAGRMTPNQNWTNRSNYAAEVQSDGITKIYYDANISDRYTLATGSVSGWASGTHTISLSMIGTSLIFSVDGVNNLSINDSNLTSGNAAFAVDTLYFSSLSDFRIYDESVTPTPTPTSTPSQIGVSPSSANVTVEVPFTVNVAVNGGGQPFNAARANVGVSSNLTITGIHNASSPVCNLQYTQTPTTTNPSFAGGIVGTSSTNCNVYTLTLTPNAEGTGTITFTNGSIKSYADHSELLTGVQNGSFTIGAQGATPTPTPGLSPLTFTNVVDTYDTLFNLTGTKDAAITQVFVNGSDADTTYPTSTSWQVPVTLSIGNNTFTLYGKDEQGNQTATQQVTVNRHTLGDINGDGVVDIIDASLFAVDWDKTSNLTYPLSDMNGDGQVDLTDLSILVKAEGQ